ncbi:MAG TPA: carboxymuconolactone decarboxylase family protein [Methanomassiliicoccales archaeon]
MDPRTKELAAIAASVAGRCQPCFKHHLGKALELGIGEDDIKEIITLAERVGGAGGQRMSGFVEITMKETKKEESNGH